MTDDRAVSLFNSDCEVLRGKFTFDIVWRLIEFVSFNNIDQFASLLI